MARDTIVDRFLANGEEHGPLPALWYRRGSIWKHFTWKQYVEKARAFAGALLALGFGPGDCVGIMSNNNPEWVISDLGTMLARGVPAGIYQSSTASQALYIANHCEAKVVVLEDLQMWEALGGQDWAAKLEHVERIVMIRDAESTEFDAVASFADFLASGTDFQDEVDARIEQIDSTDLATLIYTVGTASPAKGVMLSHENLAWTAKQSLELIGGADPNDSIVSYLPLARITEQMFSILLPASAGIPVWFAHDNKKVRDVMIVARPTLFLAAPRAWDEFRNTLESRLAEATGPRGSVVDFSRATLLKAGYVIIDEGEQGLSLTLKLRYQTAHKLFATKLQTGLGFDRLRVAAAGAAPISKEVLEFFLSVGIIIHEVYGQPENTGPTTYNVPVPGKRRLGSAGRPFPGTDVMIADDGEILVRGPNVFMGYYKNPDATAAVLTDDWLHSGDTGRFDNDGFLYVTGRKEDIV